jgi:hypothetical protein
MLGQILAKTFIDENQTRPLGRTPSLFIDEYWVYGAEQCFEEWLYRHGFRPAWDNFLGATETLDGIDADTLNAYYRDVQRGFQSDRKRSRRGHAWGNVAAFAARIKSIKQFVREQHVDDTGISSTVGVEP